jgi:hypothetical protein
MQLSLADVIADWTVYAIRTFATLPFNLQVSPFVSGKDAPAERLIVKVEIGEQIVAADQCFMGTMTLTFKTTKRDAAAANDIWAKVEAALVSGLQTTGSNARALTLFSRLDFITEEATTGLDNTSNFRHYTRTIPLHAKLL